MLNDLADLKEGVSSISSRMLALLEGSVDVFMLYLDGQPNCGHIFLRDAEAAARLSARCGGGPRAPPAFGQPTSAGTGEGAVVR